MTFGLSGFSYNVHNTLLSPCFSTLLDSTLFARRMARQRGKGQAGLPMPCQCQCQFQCQLACLSSAFVCSIAYVQSYSKLIHVWAATAYKYNSSHSTRHASSYALARSSSCCVPNDIQKGKSVRGWRQRPFFKSHVQRSSSFTRGLSGHLSRPACSVYMSPRDTTQTRIRGPREPDLRKPYASFFSEIFARLA